MDLIEDDDRKTDISVKYERKHINAEKIPKLCETKAKLTLANDQNQETLKEVGRLDVNAYLSALKEEQDKEALQTNNVNNDLKVKVLDRKSIFNTASDPREIEKEKTY